MDGCCWWWQSGEHQRRTTWRLKKAVKMSVCMKLLVAISLTMTLSHVGVHSARSEPRTMTAKQKSDILIRHNVLRAKEDAADMEMITWNETLAKGAAELASRCWWKHVVIRLPGTNIIHYGSNFYTTSGGATISMVKAVQSWYGQKPNYYFDITRCKYNRTCAYYLQLVWARTRQVGCAYHYCDTLELSSATKAEFLVCLYMPQGNFPGMEPFKKGPACSKCWGGSGWCTGRPKLCNRNCSKAGRGCSCAAHCHDCAKLNLKTCRCCVDGWWGTDCSRRCEEKPTVCTDAYRCSDHILFEIEPMLCPVVKCSCAHQTLTQSLVNVQCVMDRVHMGQIQQRWGWRPSHQTAEMMMMMMMWAVIKVNLSIINNTAL